MQIIKTLNRIDLKNNKLYLQVIQRYGHLQALVRSEYRLYFSVIPYSLLVSWC